MYRATRIELACKLRERMPIEDVARTMGIAVQSARNYVNSRLSYTGRTHEPEQPDLPRCVCGLLLPCTCNGKKRSAVDFMGRRGSVFGRP